MSAEITETNLPNVGDRLDYRQVGQLISLCNANKCRARVLMRGGFVVEEIESADKMSEPDEVDDGFCIGYLIPFSWENAMREVKRLRSRGVAATMKRKWYGWIVVS